MAKFVRIILFLLLAVTFHGMAGNTFTERTVEEAESVVDYPVYHTGDINAPEYPYSPVAELTNLQSHQTPATRIQRVQLREYITTLRNLLQCCAKCDDCLTQHWGRIYNTTTSYYCQFSSEYYVFALRRMLI
ncbi:hypothetical protein [uncultured Bacteroides sp.]|uniref:hypothetical protein n=1 Tax=uncultured Bacteroides sp. TaxID=162156 RepID=UPI0025E220A8|nr:hypothetical protein [uncultured Bacteroides sp.]